MICQNCRKWSAAAYVAMVGAAMLLFTLILAITADYRNGTKPSLVDKAKALCSCQDGLWYIKGDVVKCNNGVWFDNVDQIEMFDSSCP